jgi:hypothetical protein
LAGAGFFAAVFLAGTGFAAAVFFAADFLAAGAFLAGAAFLAGVDFFLAGADLADLPVARDDTKDPSTRTVDGRAGHASAISRTGGSGT